MTAPSATILSAPSEAAQASSDQGDLRVLAFICLAMFIAVINFVAPAAFFPVIAHDLKTSVPLLGQVATAILLLSALLGLQVGPLADRYGRRRLLMIGVLAVALNLVGIGLAPTIGVLLALALLGGLGDAILFGLALAVASTAFSGPARQRAVSWATAALPLGAIVGIPAMTAAGGIVSWRLVFVGTGILTSGAIWLAAAWLPPDQPPTATPIGWSALRPVYLPLLRNLDLRAYYLAGLVRMACWEGAITYWGAFLDHELSFSVERIGFAFLISGIGALVGGLLAGGRLGRGPLRPLVAVATIVQGLILGAVFVLPLGSAPTIFLIGVGSGIATFGFALMTTLVAQHARGGSATVMVLNGSLLNVGSAFGGALGGLLLALSGYAALGLALSILAVIAAALVWRTRPLPSAMT